MKIKTGILVCEEEGRKRSELADLLKLLGVKVAASGGLPEAESILRANGARLLFVVNLAALGTTPVGTLRRLRKDIPGLSIIGLGRIRRPQSGIALLDAGLLDSIAVPGDALGLYSSAKRELDKKDLLVEKEGVEKRLRELRIEQAGHIKRAQELESLFGETVENLITALDLRDVETFGHSQTVAKYSQVLARVLGIKDETRLANIRKGAILHDIGKIAIPDSILKKSAGLSPEEWEKIKLHPWLGYGLVRGTNLPREAGDIILCHHERYDGAGYPRGLNGDEIPLEARIFAVADSLDAITAHRPYRSARDFEAEKEILKNSGAQFDPRAVAAFCAYKPEKWERIRFETTSFIPRIEEFSLLLKKSTP